MAYIKNMDCMYDLLKISYCVSILHETVNALIAFKESKYRILIFELFNPTPAVYCFFEALTDQKINGMALYRIFSFSKILARN